MNTAVMFGKATDELRSVQVRFLKGRLTFGGAKAGAPFPSVVIVFRKPA